MGEIDYEDGDQLVFGADYSETENKDVHLHVVRGTDSRKSNFHEEVRYVGKTIKELISGKIPENIAQYAPVVYLQKILNNLKKINIIEDNTFGFIIQ